MTEAEFCKTTAYNNLFIAARALLDAQAMLKAVEDPRGAEIQSALATATTVRDALLHEIEVTEDG